MVDTRNGLFALAAVLCFTAVTYGLVVLFTRPEAGFTDVYPALFPVVPGLVFAARALGLLS